MHGMTRKECNVRVEVLKPALPANGVDEAALEGQHEALAAEAAHAWGRVFVLQLANNQPG